MIAINDIGWGQAPPELRPGQGPPLYFQEPCQILAPRRRLVCRTSVKHASDGTLAACTSLGHWPRACQAFGQCVLVLHASTSMGDLVCTTRKPAGIPAACVSERLCPNLSFSMHATCMHVAGSRPHQEIWMHYPTTNNAHAKVFWAVLVRPATCRACSLCGVLPPGIMKIEDTSKVLAKHVSKFSRNVVLGIHLGSHAL